MRIYILPYISSIFLAIVLIQLSSILLCTPGRPVRAMSKRSHKTILIIPKTKAMKEKFHGKNKTKSVNVPKNDVNNVKRMERQVQGPMPPKGRLDIWTEEARRIVFSVGPRYQGKL